jgi:hypothetical protein
MICIAHGEVCGAVICGCAETDRALAEWAARAAVTEIVRVPVEVARRFLLQPWPGLKAALALLAQAEAPSTSAGGKTDG